MHIYSLHFPLFSVRYVMERQAALRPARVCCALRFWRTSQYQLANGRSPASYFLFQPPLSILRSAFITVALNANDSPHPEMRKSWPTLFQVRREVARPEDTIYCYLTHLHVPQSFIQIWRDNLSDNTPLSSHDPRRELIYIRGVSASHTNECQSPIPRGRQFTSFFPFTKKWTVIM